MPREEKRTTVQFVSWNLKHIVKMKTIAGVNAVNTAEGYRELKISTVHGVISNEQQGTGSHENAAKDQGGHSRRDKEHVGRGICGENTSGSGSVQEKIRLETFLA
ncbi:MAG: hypothetical protein AB1742_11825 [bacterium]